MKKHYKAFGKGMVCRDKQYAENTEYEEDGGDICEKGMLHFCETPFDTLDYYPLIDDNGDFSEFAEVEPIGDVVKEGNKCASKKIRIGAKLSFRDFITAGVEALIEKTKREDNTFIWAQIGCSGDDAQISSSGYCAQIGNSGDRAKINSSGNGAQIGNSGDWAQIGSSGYCAHIGNSGDRAKINSSGNGAQIGNSGDWAQIGSSGYCAQIGSSGDVAKIGSSGDEAKIKMLGYRGVAAAIGYKSCISAKIGDWIVLAEWKLNDKYEWYPAFVKAGQIDGVTLKEDTMYKLENGEFTEA